MVTVSLHEKNGIYQAVINYKDENNKRKQKWVSTRLETRGKKKLALAKAEQIRSEFEKELNSNSLCKVNKSNISNILFLDFFKDWLKIVKQTIEPSTYTSYNR